MIYNMFHRYGVRETDVAAFQSWVEVRVFKDSMSLDTLIKIDGELRRYDMHIDKIKIETFSKSTDEGLLTSACFLMLVRKTM